MSKALRARAHDTYGKVASFIEGFDESWSMVAAGFVRATVVTVDGRRWTVSYRIDAYHVEKELSKPPKLRASISLWPPESPRGKTTARERKWMQACERQARGHGYDGEWRKSPWGWRFGDFWKDLKTPRAVVAEAKRLDGLTWDAPSEEGGASRRLLKPSIREQASRRAAGVN
jgi:hypothetical protein